MVARVTEVVVVERASMASRSVGERRSAILTAAAELFAERGFRGVTIEDLGRAVGTTGPALYRHFSGKEALLGEDLVEVSARLAQRGGGVVDRDENVRGVLELHLM